MIKDDETLEKLDSVNCMIIQKKKGFRFTVDSILLVNFLKIKKTKKLLDIGTGTGIMPLLLCRKENIDKIFAVEIDETIASMAKQTVEINGLKDKITVYNENIKTFNKENEFEVIISNPPYMRLNEGKISLDDYRAGARHEINLNLHEFLDNGKRLLKNHGSFNIVYKTNRFLELIEEANKRNLYAKRIRFVYPKPNSVSDLFMIELVKGKKHNCKIEEPLYIYDENNNYTVELLTYYGIT